MSEEQRMRYAELSPGGMEAMRGVEHYLNAGSGLSPVLLELVRMRVSLMNGCEFCIGLHRRELGKHNEPESRVSAVAEWRESDAFTETERAALAWTEVVTDVQDGHVPEEAFRAVREHFADKELVDLTVAIASINAWNRVAIAFRAKWDAGRARGLSSAAGVGDGAATQVRESGPVAASAGAASAGAPSADVDDVPVNASMSDDGERAVVDDDGGKISVDEG